MRGPGRKRSHRRLCNQERRIRKHKPSVQDTSAECDLRLAGTPKQLAVINRRARCTAMRHVKRRWQAFGALPGGCTIRARFFRKNRAQYYRRGFRATRCHFSGGSVPHVAVRFRPLNVRRHLKHPAAVAITIAPLDVMASHANDSLAASVLPRAGARKPAHIRNSE